MWNIKRVIRKGAGTGFTSTKTKVDQESMTPGPLAHQVNRDKATSQESTTGTNGEVTGLPNLFAAPLGPKAELKNGGCLLCQG